MQLNKIGVVNSSNMIILVFASACLLALFYCIAMARSVVTCEAIDSCDGYKLIGYVRRGGCMMRSCDVMVRIEEAGGSEIWSARVVRGLDSFRDGTEGEFKIIRLVLSDDRQSLTILFAGAESVTLPVSFGLYFEGLHPQRM